MKEEAENKRNGFSAGNRADGLRADVTGDAPDDDGVPEVTIDVPLGGITDTVLRSVEGDVTMDVYTSSQKDSGNGEEDPNVNTMATTLSVDGRGGGQDMSTSVARLIKQEQSQQPSSNNACNEVVSSATGPVKNLNSAYGNNDFGSSVGGLIEQSDLPAPPDSLSSASNDIGFSVARLIEEDANGQTVGERHQSDYVCLITEEERAALESEGSFAGTVGERVKRQQEKVRVEEFVAISVEVQKEDEELLQEAV